MICFIHDRIMISIRSPVGGVAFSISLKINPFFPLRRFPIYDALKATVCIPVQTPIIS